MCMYAVQESKKPTAPSMTGSVTQGATGQHKANDRRPQPARGFCGGVPMKNPGARGTNGARQDFGLYPCSGE